MLLPLKKTLPIQADPGQPSSIFHMHCLKPVISGPPVKGSRWRANFYRIDYDHGQSEWSWLPVPGTFHDYKRFGTLEFK